MAPPKLLLKYRQTFIPCCPPPFYRGAKRPKFWPKFRPQSSSDRRIFEKRRFIENLKQTCQGSMIGLPPYQTWDGWFPPTPRTVGAMGTPKAKSGKFLIYPPFQRPRRVQHHKCYTTCWGRGCCKKATVPHLPIRPQQFTGGSPKRVKVVNFLYTSVPAALADYTATNVIPPIGAVADIKRLPCHISQSAAYISQGAKISPH